MLGRLPDAERSCLGCGNRAGGDRSCTRYHTRDTGGGRNQQRFPGAGCLPAAATAVESISPPPVQLLREVGGVPVSNTTLFPVGMTTVTFIFKDSNGNVGSATSKVGCCNWNPAHHGFHGRRCRDRSFRRDLRERCADQHGNGKRAQFEHQYPDAPHAIRNGQLSLTTTSCLRLCRCSSSTTSMWAIRWQYACISMSRARRRASQLPRMAPSRTY